MDLAEPQPVVVAFGSALHRDTLAFRNAHLRRPIGLVQTEAELVGEAEQMHMALVRDGSVLGTVVLKHGHGGIAKLRQMAIDPGLRGTGAGRHLVAFAESHARQAGARRIELHARISARGFYERLGYLAFGPEFLEMTLPHIAMARDI
ncbi:GNAT family N-acetyltransferase [Lichenihabitans sp. Uapishka_5]|uniref:GNAT family N-acetyltransferase n=1 Tax=Lichenihabitans sp. Uapishka_5 TaxID=3037302 RepID=UPI0029E7E2FE|nr:GNAT family N-acetyltransferase [Lichenihabitans sp. Uapishka_5]MDX7949900.1 GNAT family N-acetyltransferase [Lichenihabitans sp. Uapishka_5]